MPGYTTDGPQVQVTNTSTSEWSDENEMKGGRNDMKRNDRKKGGLLPKIKIYPSYSNSTIN